MLVSYSVNIQTSPKKLIMWNSNACLEMATRNWNLDLQVRDS